MQDAKSCKTPVNPGLKLTKANEESTLVNQELYQSAVGKLLYLSTRTRPDIAYAVSTAAKFTAKPSEEHWKAVKDILLAPLILDYNLLEVDQLSVPDLLMPTGQVILTIESPHLVTCSK